MVPYSTLKEKYFAEYNSLNKQYNLISFIRLIVIILLCIFIYYYTKTQHISYLLALSAFIICMAFLIKLHDKIDYRKQIKNALLNINNDELTYLKHEKIPFNDGNQYSDPSHLYSYDLDVFGKNSLYHHLNRTGTYIGEKTFAELLLSQLSAEKIITNQEAVKELASKINWRQDVLATALIIKDSKEIYEKLISWSINEPDPVSGFLIAVSFISPVLLCVAFIFHFINPELIPWKIISSITIFNLLIVSSIGKRINKELRETGKIHKCIMQYGLMIEKTESENFISKGLNQLKDSLLGNNNSSGMEIKKLSKLFNNLENIKNLFGAALSNSILLYHLHVYQNLQEWKKQNSRQIAGWLSVIGKFEALNSLANFCFNNPSFVFPTINNDFKISFEESGHPLIPSEKRVCNSVSFLENKFIILTGSNMSGKSTFLRTLGINILLAGIGAPVCSKNANIHPLQIVVSMRQSDSLADNESYFFAEVKRLKHIMEELKKNSCFVLLDEILRGTNSDDKRSGTIAIIKRLISKNAIGSVATHDIEICKTTLEFPHYLINKCFEVEIANDELSFDYKLREGICKNKSATFLMKKMEVI